MKHKAQKSLDILSIQPNDSACGGCNCGTEDCYGCENKESVWNIQDLINLQLTVEEMKFIANCLYVAGFVDENMVKQILGKFQKQKEMWVSEDESN